MRVCPECNTEYKGDGEKCTECTAKSEVQKESIKDKWMVLTTVANDIEFEMTSGLLATAEIPCIRKIRGVDGYLQVILGVPIAGIDVLVPPDKYEEALQLIEAEIINEDMEE